MYRTQKYYAQTHNIRRFIRMLFLCNYSVDNESNSHSMYHTWSSGLFQNHIFMRDTKLQTVSRESQENVWLWSGSEHYVTVLPNYWIIPQFLWASLLFLLDFFFLPWGKPICETINWTKIHQKLNNYKEKIKMALYTCQIGP